MEFSREELGSLQLHFAPSYDHPALKERILGIFSGRVEDAERIESSAYARVLAFDAPCQGGRRLFFYKEFFFRNLRDRLSILFRESRAKRAWTGACILTDHGLRTAMPVCLGEQRVLGIVKRSFLVTEGIPDALEIEKYIKKHFHGSDVPEKVFKKREFISLFGKTIGRMHRCGIFQGDLRERNVLVQEGDPPEIYLIDNERTRKYPRLPERKRLKNLVQANMTRIEEITRTDRLRFFLAYLEENPGLKDMRRTWMKRILSKTQARLMLKGRKVRSHKKQIREIFL